MIASSLRILNHKQPLAVMPRAVLRFRLAGAIFTLKAPAYVCLPYSALLYAIITRSVLVGIAHNA